MKTIHYPIKIRSHLVTIVPNRTRLFTPKSTSKLRSALHFRYSIVIPPPPPPLLLLNPNNHYNHSFHNIFVYKYNHFIYNDYLLCTVTGSAHIIR